MTNNFKAALVAIGIVTAMVACSVRAQDIYRAGDVYSDKPIGARVYIVDNTVAAVYPSPYPDPYAPTPQPRVERAPNVVIVNNVTVSTPAPVIQPVYVIPHRNYLAAPGWRNPHHGYR